MQETPDDFVARFKRDVLDPIYLQTADKLHADLALTRATSDQGDWSDDPRLRDAVTLLVSAINDANNAFAKALVSLIYELPIWNRAP